MKKFRINKAYASVEKFNEIAGSLHEVDSSKIDLQLSLIFEEFSETIEAFEKQDNIKLVDGAADLFVTVSGLLQQLSVAGFDVDKAVDKVCGNNLDKFPKVNTALRFDGEFTSTLNEKHQVYVIKDKAGKIRKPADFIPVDLSDCVSHNFKWENM